MIFGDELAPVIRAACAMTNSFGGDAQMVATDLAGQYLEIGNLDMANAWAEISCAVADLFDF